jgi:hypothetical protein
MHSLPDLSIKKPIDDLVRQSLEPGNPSWEWLLCPLTEPSVSLIERIKRRTVRMNATSGAELTSLPVTCRRNSTVGGSYYVITASDTAFIQTSPFRVDSIPPVIA